ncbi:tryptophan synthase subunit alpha [Parapusillimonas granuli]|uniref:Tryptophan synthase alpha chain n=1 Tax=Parapusillimonas granuli TaxID=380911 RepID=A0A853G767_9BURK|nr:tryptophan synthase subunit alpha [Parapusillimonas granuli]MEB2400083.1 tryptophan synthase subunit alpha [Alcaligenaceae bacterium]NYT51602.1 tryptophan synthase subunit alpha [Parapusillimonas granuli]
MNSSNERLLASFANRKGRTALIPYITAGDPSIQATPRLMHALVRAGADVIELGVPFSDPMADGPVIQRAGERAIRRGVGLRQVLDMVAEFRLQDQNTPVVLMGYANPIERMGPAAFAEQARQAGVDGVLVVDYPPEEVEEFAALLGQAKIDPIFLLAPTSTQERMRKIGQLARGYVYYVSLKGVTGAGHLDTDDVAARLAEIRRHVSIPVGVGFGIRDADSAKRLSACADAVVIGSKLIETMEAAVAEAGGRGASPAETDAAAIEAAESWLAGIRRALPSGG